MSMTSAGVARRRRALVVALLGAVLGCVLLATVLLGDLSGSPSGPPSGAAGGESAVALVPTSTGGDPSLLVVARVPNDAAARERLASLEAPLAQLFAGTAVSAGQAPVLNDVAVGAESIHELALAPGFTLDYSVAHGLVIVSTSRPPVAAVLRHAGALAGDSRYRAVLPIGPNGVSSLVFLDFNQLLNLVGQTGLTRGARFSALRPDLQGIRAIGIQSTSGEADSTAELSLKTS